MSAAICTGLGAAVAGVPASHVPVGPGQPEVLPRVQGVLRRQAQRGQESHTDPAGPCPPPRWLDDKTGRLRLRLADELVLLPGLGPQPLKRCPSPSRNRAPGLPRRRPDRLIRRRRACRPARDTRLQCVPRCAPSSRSPRYERRGCPQTATAGRTNNSGTQRSCTKVLRMLRCSACGTVDAVPHRRPGRAAAGRVHPWRHHISRARGRRASRDVNMYLSPTPSRRHCPPPAVVHARPVHTRDPRRSSHCPGVSSSSAAAAAMATEGWSP